MMMLMKFLYCAGIELATLRNKQVYNPLRQIDRFLFLWFYLEKLNKQSGPSISTVAKSIGAIKIWNKRFVREPNLLNKSQQIILYYYVCNGNDNLSSPTTMVKKTLFKILTRFCKNTVWGKLDP
jgi:hypothetical protein